MSIQISFVVCRSHFCVSFSNSAVKSALLQQRALEKLREGWAQRGMPELRVRMGLTTGPVVAGNVGSKFRMKYTLMGDR